MLCALLVLLQSDNLLATLHRATRLTRRYANYRQNLSHSSKYVSSNISDKRCVTCHQIIPDTSVEKDNSNHEDTHFDTINSACQNSAVKEYTAAKMVSQAASEHPVIETSDDHKVSQ